MLSNDGLCIAVVQSRNDKGLVKKLCSVLCKEGPDLSDVVQCKRAVFAIYIYIYIYIYIKRISYFFACLLTCHIGTCRNLFFLLSSLFLVSFFYSDSFSHRH